MEIFTEFQSMWDEHLGKLNIANYRIELTPENIQLINSVPYRAVLKAREFQNTEFEKMRAQNVTEPDQTERAAPMLFAQKKNGSLRFCVNYRKLNAVTKRDSFPIACIDECTSSFGEATVFSTLNPNRGY